ncbi:MAG: anthranilate synthase component I family protein [Bacteroidia bacterium]|nr:anthranilate synthase component I family protein [Bacteroidia bacterium]NNF31261.1 anthranilate synthase component I family protein [Flavobacteriaceae bacterium]MBT8275887.1 anthranilate synthase component I family protein [Bacteroidia bacterium]NNJ82946.1 anthranilate synthase component I family protein [Flavobacteriaceae bacterium]NNK54544.1 anthranilate synthase component I family protein [Flavobacteriaceae bacterium]
MKRIQNKHSHVIDETFRKKLLLWAQQFHEVAWLDSNNYQQEHSSYQAILAVDAFTSLKTDYIDAFQKLDDYQSSINDWLFGYLTYDLKNDIEALSSLNHDGLGFPDLFFFQPKRLFLFSKNNVEMHYLNMVADEMEADWKEINNIPHDKNSSQSENASVKISLRTSKDSYFKEVNKMLAHIERGDIYEANFCQEFFSEDIAIDPVKTFDHLNEISRPPFATYLKFGNSYAMSASPERYLKKVGTSVISQPIKGTARRFKNEELDRAMIEKLKNDPKERSENIMITDLVRNDLSKFAEKGSVLVEELCAVYSFEQVHQLISTVSCEVSEDVKPATMLKETFPMGSMTGAPKVSAMKIIEDLEDAKRGLYSGAIGYFAPNNDFDFNVVIRSILYNANKKYVSFSVGGAITAKSSPEDEYEECLLKAKAMREALEQPK